MITASAFGTQVLEVAQFALASLPKPSTSPSCADERERLLRKELVNSIERFFLERAIEFLQSLLCLDRSMPPNAVRSQFVIGRTIIEDISNVGATLMLADVHVRECRAAAFLAAAFRSQAKWFKRINHYREQSKRPNPSESVAAQITVTEAKASIEQCQRLYDEFRSLVPWAGLEYRDLSKPGDPETWDGLSVSDRCSKVDASYRATGAEGGNLLNLVLACYPPWSATVHGNAADAAFLAVDAAPDRSPHRDSALELASVHACVLSRRVAELEDLQDVSRMESALPTYIKAGN